MSTINNGYLQNEEAPSPPPPPWMLFIFLHFPESCQYATSIIHEFNSVYSVGRVEPNYRQTRATKQEIQDLKVAVGRAEGLAVDWLSGNIYWTDAKKRVIEVATKDGYYRYRLFAGLRNIPHALVLDPTNR